jgi:surface polysaccharide O-acyltransferase-like enzyme
MKSYFPYSYFQIAIACIAFFSPLLTVSHPEYIEHSEKLSLLGAGFLLKTSKDTNERIEEKKDIK